MWALSNVSEWGDESETIVAAKMLANGKELYTEISNPHGPASFIPGLILELTGFHSVRAHRGLIIAGQLLAVLSIAFSPMLKTRRSRIVVANICLILVASFGSKYLLNTYTYQAIAAILLTIVVAQLLARLPAESRFDDFRFWAIVTGFSISTLPFLSVQYLPLSVVFLAIFGVRCKNSFFWLGVLSGLFINCAFLVTHSSVNGMYALHIYMPTKIIPKYGGQEASLNLLQASFSTVIGSFGALIIFVVAVFLYSFVATEKWKVLQVMLFAGMLLTLAVRPLYFHLAPYLVFGLVWIILSSAYLLKDFSDLRLKSRLNFSLFVSLWLVGIIKVSMLYPGSRDLMDIYAIPKDTDFSRAAEMYTEESDEVLAFTFRSYEYIAANRQPASAQYTYLAWQADYERNPVRGVTFDLCKDIDEQKPKLILMDKAELWNQSWESYAACVIKIVNEDYKQIEDKPIYLLK
jgi:hypothetical protein